MPSRCKYDYFCFSYRTTNAYSSLMSLILIGVMFLPFTQALTVDIGFPLKLSELMFATYLPVYYFYSSCNKVKIPSRSLANILFLFVIVVVLSAFAAQIDSGEAVKLDFRGGYNVDSTTRVIYLVFSIFVALMLYAVTLVRDGSSIVKFWLLGLVLTVCYHIYTIVSVYIAGDAFLLPGVERHQMGWVGNLHIPRSGTFREGNFASLYYLASLVFAVHYGMKIFVAFSVIGLLLTQSTSGLAGLIVFLFVFYILVYGLSYKWLSATLFLTVISMVLFLQFDVASKFDMAAGVSGGVRFNLAMTGFNIFIDNPFLGVGLGGYGYYFNSYEWYPSLSALSVAAKQIPNNVYIELLSEVGGFGSLLYFFIWFIWARMAWRIRRVHPEFMSFIVAASVVIMAFPTFNILYIWCFYGISLALMKSSCVKNDCMQYA